MHFFYSYFDEENRRACVEIPPTPAPNNKTRSVPSHRRRDGVRHFFDRADYITYRLFLYAMALIGIIAVIRASLR
jgi:hypothetical protein